MISNITTIIQEDLVTMVDFCRDKLSDQEKPKACYAAIRIIASFGMAYGAYIAVAALSAGTPAGVLVGLVKAGLMYAAAHDVFVIAKRTEDHQNPVKRVLDIGANFFGQTKDALKAAWNGRQVNGAVAHPLTQGTFYRPLWNALLDEVVKW